MKRFATLAVTAMLQQSVSAQPPPPKTYKCDPESFKCVECPVAGGICDFLPSCENNCGKFTPPELIGVWRGLVIGNGTNHEGVGSVPITEQYLGEFDMNIMNGTLKMHIGGDTKSDTECKVVTTQGGTVAIQNCTDPNAVVQMNWNFADVAQLKYTNAIGFSTNGTQTPGEYMGSFAEGVRRNDTLNLVMFRCNKWGDQSTCDFTQDGVKQTFEKLIGRVQEGCSRCDRANGRCEACTCGTGVDCLTDSTCESKCVPEGQKYKCSWKSGTPTCIADDSGT